MPTPHHLTLGAIIFPGLDQIDFTGPFEVLSRLPDSTFHVLWKQREPVRDINGLLLLPEMTFHEAPPLDVLIIPGGNGQEPLLEDEETLAFIRRQAEQAACVFSVCTGALLCGAAGLLRGVRATTHWTAFHLLEYFGAIPVDARVVIDGKIVTAAGVTAGIDGALRVAALLRGDETAQQIQLAIQYAPEPPFNSGSPQTAPAKILEAATAAARRSIEARLVIAKRVAQKLGVTVGEQTPGA
jgi:cyclohexyl-isocyanide hydratase